jgi:hypothetical protein
MASITGTAATPLALYNALIAFLTNSGLLGSQVWSVAWNAPVGAPNLTDIILAGPGLSASEQIYVGLRLNQDALNDRYSIDLFGATGIIPSAQQVGQHVNSSPDGKRLFLINQPMQYWFTANGRRFTITVKVSNIYESAYAGFLLPYSLPSNYSYPLFIGAMAGTVGAAIPLSWTDTTDAHRFYPAGAINTITGTAYSSPAVLLDPMGQWLPVTGFRASGGGVGQVGVLPYEAFTGFNLNQNATNLNDTDQYPYQSIAQRITRNFANEFNLIPYTLVQASPADQTYGVLDGIYFAPGNLQTVENVITISGTSYLVVGNAFRSGQLDFLATRLS